MVTFPKLLFCGVHHYMISLQAADWQQKDRSVVFSALIILLAMFQYGSRGVSWSTFKDHFETVLFAISI